MQSAFCQSASRGYVKKVTVEVDHVKVVFNVAFVRVHAEHSPVDVADRLGAACVRVVSALVAKYRFDPVVMAPLRCCQ